MDSERFDRWAKLLALRMSRRTAAAAVGAATVVSLTSPRWVLGQDDDEDPDTDDDQNTGDQDGDDGDDVLGADVCLDIVSCKKYRCIDSVGPDGKGDCSWITVGDIPGGPYEQEWSWKPFGCRPKGHTDREFEAMCNQAWPGENRCDNQCAGCATVSLTGCA